MPVGTWVGMEITTFECTRQNGASTRVRAGCAEAALNALLGIRRGAMTGPIRLPIREPTNEALLPRGAHLMICASAAYRMAANERSQMPLRCRERQGHMSQRQPAALEDETDGRQLTPIAGCAWPCRAAATL